MIRLVLLILITPVLAAAQHTVTLSCNPGVGGDPATGFNFYRTQTQGTGYVKLTATPNPTCQHVDTGVPGGRTFYYVATSINATGESGYSNEIKAVIPIAPPKDLKIAPPTDVEVETE